MSNHHYLCSLGPSYSFIILINLEQLCKIKPLMQFIWWLFTKTSLFKYTENFTTKKWKFSEKNSDMFHISARNIDCGYLLELPWLPCQGSSNRYPQSLFLSRNKKNNVYPCKRQFFVMYFYFAACTLWRPDRELADKLPSRTQVRSTVPASYSHGGGEDACKN